MHVWKISCIYIYMCIYMYLFCLCDTCLLFVDSIDAFVCSWLCGSMRPLQRPFLPPGEPRKAQIEKY